MNKEIELKFEVKDMPQLDGHKKIDIYKIVQYYLYKDEFSAIRKREIFDINNNTHKYIYTVKTKGDIQNNKSVYEIETVISREKYEAIQENKNIVEKYRIKVPIDENLIAELDIYGGNLEGLITVEVEFENEMQLDKFIKPVWFGSELDKIIFSNANLSSISREKFVNLVGKDNINKNILLVKKIREKININ